MAYLLGGVLIGLTMALTVYNTILLHKKDSVKVEEPSEEQKKREKQFDALMNFRGRTNDRQ